MTVAAIADMTEKEWASQVSDLCKLLGWRRYHTYRSERSAPGFPDETLVRDRVVFLELKREKGKLADAQKDWLRDLLAAGAEAYVVRPADLDDLAQILGCKGSPFRPIGPPAYSEARGGSAHEAALRLSSKTRVAVEPVAPP